MLVLSRTTTNAYKLMLLRHDQLRLMYAHHPPLLVIPTDTMINCDALDHKAAIKSLYDFDFINNDVKIKISDTSNRRLNKNKSLNNTASHLWGLSHLSTLSEAQRSELHASYYVTFSSGIRDSIEIIMTHFKKMLLNPVFHIAPDLYPVYQHLADKTNVKYNVYHTINDDCTVSKLNFMCSNLSESADPEIVIITDPVPITQTVLGKKEIDVILEWLLGKSNRYLIIDSVYSAAFNPLLYKLFATNQIFYLNSLSKSHCMPNFFGINIIPKGFIFNNDSTSTPWDELFHRAISLMSIYPQKYCVVEQKKLFVEAWKTLNKKISPIIPGLPKIIPGLVNEAYLLFYKKSYEQLLKQNVLAIPLSVYERPDLESVSIISCLDEVKKLTTLNTLTKKLYHVTILSNFSRAYEKYTNTFDKHLIPHSTFKDMFHLLTLDDIDIGISKVTKLIKKLAVKGNRLLVIETNVNNTTPIMKTANGNGYYIDSNRITVDNLYLIEGSETIMIKVQTETIMVKVQTETIMAQSFALNDSMFKPYDELIPRTISLLPIAQGCQAKCSFCFSHSSVSDDVLQKKLNIQYIEKVFIESKKRGAVRAVITGGGEPTLIPHHILLSYIVLCKKYFNKNVMITNGYTYSGPKIDELMRKNLLLDLQQSGLDVLSVSRHGYDEDSNEKIMHLRTNVSLIGHTIKNNELLFDKMKLRLVCVIQKNGVDSSETLEKYINWALQSGGWADMF
jgi:uncharacterized Fe-S cluster-containing radical SAM superfamily protein